MASFDVQDPDFEASARESFGSLALMRTIGARLSREARRRRPMSIAWHRISRGGHGIRPGRGSNGSSAVRSVNEGVRAGRGKDLDPPRRLATNWLLPIPTCAAPGVERSLA